MQITHAKVSGKTDGGDATLVQPSDWNDDHVVAGSAGYPIDQELSLDATYGDHYDSSTLDAKWTVVGRAAESHDIARSHLMPHPYNAVNYGDLQALTDADEIDVTMAASVWSQETDEGFGPCILSSANTGLWLGYRNSSRLGIFTVTTGTTATEPSHNSAIAGSQFFGTGEKRWFRLSKRKCGGVDIYFWAVSIDGALWWTPPSLGGYDPTDFTPAKVGWLVGVQSAATTNRGIAIDWFNATRKTLSANRLVTPTSGTVTASSDATSQTNSPSLVIDGNLGNEWLFPSTNSAGVYWQAAFSVAQSINRVRIRGRSDGWGSGRVVLSDGTTQSFYGIGAGYWTIVDFDEAVSTTSIRVYWHKQGYGANPGFSEIEAYLAT